MHGFTGTFFLWRWFLISKVTQIHASDAQHAHDVYHIRLPKMTFSWGLHITNVTMGIQNFLF